MDHADRVATEESGSPGASPLPQRPVYIGRQPIVDRTRSLVAFELRFQDAEARAEATSESHAGLIVNAFTDFGIHDTLGPHRGFVSIGRELLMSEALAALPANRIVLELDETVEPDDAVIARCKALRADGYRLAIDHVVAFDTRVKRLLPCVNMLKLDVGMDDALLARFVSALGRLPVLLIADRVETRERAAHCLAHGFHLFQGYHFAQPQIVEGRRAAPARLALLKLTTLLMEDADTAALEDALKQHPDLVYNLLRIVNSAAFGLRRQIDTLPQCIAVLGHRRLAQWVQLLLYAPAEMAGAASNPLMQLAATRGKWMENLATLVRPAERKLHDLAFMVGILSLLDALLGMRLEAVVDNLNLADEVRAALLARKGMLGLLLRLIEDKEKNDFDAVRRGLHDLPFLTLQNFTAAELSAALWAHGAASSR